MDLSFFLFLLLSLTIFISIFIHYLVSKHNPQPATSKVTNEEFQLPPGTTGWPLIGETLDYISKVKNGIPERFVNDRRNKFSSKVFKTSILGEKMAILCGKEGNKFLFSNGNKFVESWWPDSINKLVHDSQGTNTKHIKAMLLRSRKMLPMFVRPDSLQHYMPVTDEITKKHLENEWGNREEVKVCPLVRKYVLASSFRLFLSIDGDEQSIENLAKPFNDMAAGLISWPLDLPGTAFNCALKASRKIRREIESLIKKRSVDISEKRASPKQEILSKMIQTRDENGQLWSVGDVTPHIMALLLAGYDTLNIVLTFVIMYLAEFPDVYNKVLKEQMEIVNSKEPNELLNWEDTRRMKYSWNVACEVLRLRPPAGGAFREVITDFTYAGYLIPKGWKLHWIANSTHRNPEHFPNPEKFDPSRFEDSGPAPYTFVPFGGGPRMCPGNEYARMVILVFMHNMVTKFRWEKLLPNEKIANDPTPRPTQGLPVRLYPHKS